MAWQGRGRHRNMYNLTGLPGFVRFGYSPGWVGRSPTGLGPCAQYLTENGQLDKFITDMTTRANIQPTYNFNTSNPEQRLQFLKTHYETLKSQLDNIEKEIKELESTIKGD